MTNALPLDLIDPSTFEVDVTLEISCDDEDQILSRPVGDGFTYQELEQSHVRFSGDDESAGAVPEDAASDIHSASGYCQSVELTLSAKTFGGVTVQLGCFGSEDQVEKAKAAIALPVNLLLGQN